MAKDFADELMLSLKDYCDDIGDQILAEAEKLSRKARAELKAASPKSTGDYSKGWHLTKFGGGGRFRIVVRNDENVKTATNFSLWLEEGFTHHPDMGSVEPQPHIEPIQERLNNEFESACERIIKNKS